ncbi:MAG: hypothetical protein AAGA10_14130 [Bacteroidota bacterium]
MKHSQRCCPRSFLNLVLFVFLLSICSSFSFRGKGSAESKPIPDEVLESQIQGAWKMVEENTSPWEDLGGWAQMKLISNGYFMVGVYDSKKKQFLNAAGGTYAVRNGKYTEYILFHTVDPSLVGKSFTFQIRVDGARLIQNGNVRIDGINMHLSEEYQRIDYGTESPLAGAWRKQTVQQAYVNSQKRESTLMLTTGTRFQRVSYNSTTKRVGNVMGGTYSYRNNQWVETHKFNKNSPASINRRFSYEARYEGRKMGIKKRSGYRPDTYIRLD